MIIHYTVCSYRNFSSSEVRSLGPGLADTVGAKWYSLPDAWNPSMDANRKWHTSTCHAHDHTCMADIMNTLLGRSDGETTNCRKCNAGTGMMFQLTWTKTPQYSSLPLSLELELDPTLDIPAELEFEVGGIRYILVGVVFGNTGHFTANIVLSNAWWHYDGIQLVACAMDDLPAIPLFTLIKEGDDHMTPPPCNGQSPYKPIAYRYMRTGASSLAPLQVLTCEDVPRDRQFNNMWRLV
jgi:hypothetical protein